MRTVRIKRGGQLSHKGTSLDERNSPSRFHALLNSLGLPKIRLYDLRHTHASLLIAEGKPPKLIAERADQSSAHAMDQYFQAPTARPTLRSKSFLYPLSLCPARQSGQPGYFNTRLIQPAAYSMSAATFQAGLCCRSQLRPRSSPRSSLSKAIRRQASHTWQAFPDLGRSNGSTATWSICAPTSRSSSTAITTACGSIRHSATRRRKSLSRPPTS